jgi:hypothetical protein
MSPIATDSRARAMGMALTAFLVGYAVDSSLGMYSVDALRLLLIAVIVCIATIAAPRFGIVESIPPWLVDAALALGIAFEASQIIIRNQNSPLISRGTAIVAALGLLQAFELKRLRLPLIALASIAFAILASMMFLTYARNPHIDVFVFQQMSADGLLHGHNPYEIRYPSLYPPGTPFYGPGVVNPADNRLDYGFPYFPLSLLLVVPAYAIGGDSRYAHVIAIAASAVLMAAARPGRRSGLIAALFLLVPTVFFIIEQSWTEPLLALTFSLTMFCALRWKRGLPCALGLLFATKQYTVLMVPLVWLLVEEPRSWKTFAVLLAKAAVVALAITVPFLLWNPRAFYRAVAAFQFLQPFRLDALSFLVWIHHNVPQLKIERWAPFASILPVTAFALWRCARSPAGFAAAVTLVYLLFFAFNKQAFANYYYFVVATACWACAAGQGPAPVEPRSSQSVQL